MNIVMINGKSGAGKDTLVRNITKKYQKEIKQLSFATRPKEIIQEIFDLPEESLWGTQEEKEQKLPEHIRFADKRWNTTRDFVKWFASGICRDVDPYCWAKCVVAEIRLLEVFDDYKTVIISDLGLKDELLHMDKEFGMANIKLVRILRKFDEPGSRYNEESLDCSPNENFDLVIPDEYSEKLTFETLENSLKEWKYV